jgi:diguanylate cyclase (GGDEF)-like protein
MKKLFGYFERLPKAAVVVIGLVLVLAMGEVDYITGYESAFSIFYVFPVFLVTWFVGLRWGIIFSVLSGFTWLAADLLSGHHYSNPAIAFWNMMVRATTFMIIASTVSQLNRVLSAEKNFARTDALTGISNTKHFQELASRMVRQNEKDNKQCAVGFIDLDNFKNINDEYGHSTGDQLLKLAAGIIKQNLREEDVVARLGGDEFGVIIFATTQKTAETIFDRIRKNFLFEMKKRKWPVTFSGGVVYFENCTASVDEMIGMADRLMYTVKKNGKDGIKYQCQNNSTLAKHKVEQSTSLRNSCKEHFSAQAPGVQAAVLSGGSKAKSKVPSK